MLHTLKFLLNSFATFLVDINRQDRSLLHLPIRNNSTLSQRNQQDTAL